MVVCALSGGTLNDKIGKLGKASGGGARFMGENLQGSMRLIT